VTQITEPGVTENVKVGSLFSLNWFFCSVCQNAAQKDLTEVVAKNEKEQRTRVRCSWLAPSPEGTSPISN
jgi:hypothetical protein